MEVLCALQGQKRFKCQNLPILSLPIKTKAGTSLEKGKAYVCWKTWLRDTVTYLVCNLLLRLPQLESQ